MSQSINSWLDVFAAVHACARESRGIVEINPLVSDQSRWPRTTCADVIAIAAVIDPHVRALPDQFGCASLTARWCERLQDLERLALYEAAATFPANRSFWRTLHVICIFMHSLDLEPPDSSTIDALLRQLETPLELRNVGPTGDGPFKHFEVKTFSDLFLEQYKFLRELRGADNRDPEPGMTGGKKLIPRSTNTDVVALADYWSKQLFAIKKVFGHESVEKRWTAALGDVATYARKGDPKALYPKNNGFWRDLQATAIHVSVADEAPSSTDMMLESLKDSLKGLPESIEAGVKAVSKGAVDLASGIAHGVGQIANQAGKGLFSGAGVPLLVGAGLVGLFLVSRRRGEAAE